jgi:hypothetical protein
VSERIVSSFIAIAIVFGAGAVRAQPASESEADKLFREGRAAMQKQDYATACAKLEQSQKLDPQPGTLVNLGLCLEARGELGAALKRLRSVTEQLPSGDPRAQVAMAHIQDVEARLPRLTIRLSTGAPPGTRVARDGDEIPLAAFGQAQSIEVGAHTVVVIAPGRADRSYEVTLAEKEQRVLVVEPGVLRSGTGSVDPTANTASSSSGRRTAGFVIAGIGIAGLALSGVATAVMLGKASDVETLCPDGVCSSTEGLDAASAGRTWSTVGTVAFAGGLLAAGLGVALVLSAPRDASSSSSSALFIAPRAGGVATGWGGAF